MPEASSTCELVYRSSPEGADHKGDRRESVHGDRHRYGSVSVFLYLREHHACCRGSDEPGNLILPVLWTGSFPEDLCTAADHGQSLLNARLYIRGDLRIVASVLTPEDMAECGALPKHLEGIVSQLQNTKDVEASLFLYPMEDGVYKVSIRSSKKVDAAAIAVKYQGGGHVRAAGCSLSGEDPWKMAEMLIRDVCDQVGLPAAEAD